ncbi:hypothetical protein D3C87_2043610 [compost metagenome]
MTQLHFHHHIGMVTQVDLDDEGFFRECRPALELFDQQAFERQIDQAHKPNVCTLAQLGPGVEGDALVMTPISMEFSHV